MGALESHQAAYMLHLAQCLKLSCIFKGNQEILVKIQNSDFSWEGNVATLLLSSGLYWAGSAPLTGHRLSSVPAPVSGIAYWIHLTPCTHLCSCLATQSLEFVTLGPEVLWIPLSFLISWWYVKRQWGCARQQGPQTKSDVREKEARPLLTWKSPLIIPGMGRRTLLSWWEFCSPVSYIFKGNHEMIHF